MQLRCSKRNKLLCCFVVILLTITLANAGRVPDIKTKGEPPIKKSKTEDVSRGTDQEGVKTTRTDVGESTAANVAEALSQGASMARHLEEIKIVREQVAKAPTRVSHQKNQEPRPFAHTLDISSVFSAVKPDEGEPKAGTSAQAKEEEIRTDELGAFINKQEEIKAKIIGNPRPFVVTFNFEQIKQKLTELFQRDPVIQQNQKDLYWEQLIEEYVKVGTIIQISAVKNSGNPSANFPSSGKFVKCIGMNKGGTNPIYQLFGVKETQTLPGWLGLKYTGITKNVDLATEFEPFWGRRIQQVKDFKEGKSTWPQAEGGTKKDSRTKTDTGAVLQKPFPIDFTFQYVKDKLKALESNEPIMRPNKGSSYWEIALEEFVSVGQVMQISEIIRHGGLKREEFNIPMNGRYIQCEGWGSQVKRVLWAVIGRPSTLQMTLETIINDRSVRNVNPELELPMWQKRFEKVEVFSRRNEKFTFARDVKDVDLFQTVNSDPKPDFMRVNEGRTEYFDKHLNRYVGAEDEIVMNSKENAKATFHSASNDDVKYTCWWRKYPTTMPSIVKGLYLRHDSKDKSIFPQEEALKWWSFISQNKRNWDDVVWDVNTIKGFADISNTSEIDAHIPASAPQVPKDMSAISDKFSDQQSTDQSFTTFMHSAFVRRDILNRPKNYETLVDSVYFERALGIHIRIGEKIRLSLDSDEDLLSSKSMRRKDRILTLQRPPGRSQSLIYLLRDSAVETSLHAYIRNLSPDEKEMQVLSDLIKLETRTIEFHGDTIIQYKETALPPNEQYVSIGQVVLHNNRYYSLVGEPIGHKLYWERLGSNSPPKPLLSWNSVDLSNAKRLEASYEKHHGEPRKLVEYRPQSGAGQENKFEFHETESGQNVWMKPGDILKVEDRNGQSMELEFIRLSVCGTKLMYVKFGYEESNVLSLPIWIKHGTAGYWGPSWMNRVPIFDTKWNTNIEMHDVSWNYFSRGSRPLDVNSGFVYVYRVKQNTLVDINDDNQVYKLGMTINHPLHRMASSARNNHETYQMMFYIPTSFPFLAEQTIHHHYIAVNKRIIRNEIPGKGDGKTEYIQDSLMNIKERVKVVVEEIKNRILSNELM